MKKLVASKINICDKTIRKIKPSGCSTFHWDISLKGFAIRESQAGDLTYYVRYSVKGIKKTKALGPVAELKATSARELARQVLESARLGKDFFEKGSDIPLRPTVKDLGTEHQKTHCPPTISISTFKNASAHWKLYIIPTLGHIFLDELSPQDIIKMQHVLSPKKHTSNRVLSTLSKALSDCMNWGGAWRSLTSNPCAKIKRFRESPRETILDGEELGKILSAIEGLKAIYPASDRSKPWAAPYLFQCLLFSGARLRELAMAEWSWLDEKEWSIKIPKTKTQSNFVIYLSPEIAGLLSSMPRYTKWIFPNSKGTGPMKWPAKQWQKVRELAGVSKFRLHDIRHNFGSYAHVKGGLTLKEISSHFGHSNESTTMRYLNLKEDMKKKAALKGSAAIASLLVTPPQESFDNQNQ